MSHCTRIRAVAAEIRRRATLQAWPNPGKLHPVEVAGRHKPEPRLTSGGPHESLIIWHCESRVRPCRFSLCAGDLARRQGEGHRADALFVLPRGATLHGRRRLYARRLADRSRHDEEHRRADPAGPAGRHQGLSGDQLAREAQADRGRHSRTSAGRVQELACADAGLPPARSAGDAGRDDLVVRPVRQQTRPPRSEDGRDEGI